MMPGESWPLLLVAAIILGAAAWLLLRAQQSPSLPTNIGGIRIEVIAPVLSEDRVLEQVWEVPVVLTNKTRRPRAVPVLAQRAEVRTKRARYIAELTTEVSWEREEDGARLELNPAGTTIGSVWVVLPAGEPPLRLRLQELQPKQRRLLARLTS
ncbi:hypothetical protein [Microbacterium laevaniformans]|uniref:hypothetical protein n=2 Tax=Microbacterium laevaniformans TaxID=36807 RepID=UPI00195ACDD3|nr:hypothetical protein [Microbacterium laevaniformans]